MFLLILAAAAPSEFSGETFSARRVLSETSNFTDCTFQDCQAIGATFVDSSGGGLYLSSSSSLLALANVRFSSCQAASSGGGLCVDRCLSLAMSLSSGVSCTSGILSSQHRRALTPGSFCFAMVASSAIASLEIEGCSATGCQSAYDATVCVAWEDHASGSASKIDFFNATGNAASQFASALQAYSHRRLDVRFSVLSDNRPANLILIGFAVAECEILCVDVRNNSCKSDKYYPALLCITSPVVVTDCAFRGNTVDYVVGAPPRAVSSVRFGGCVFSFPSIIRTGNVTFATEECAFGTDAGVPEGCATKGPTKDESRTAAIWTRTATAQGSSTGRKMSAAVVSGIVAGCVGAVALVLVGCICVAKRANDDPQEQLVRAQDPFTLGDNSAGSAESRVFTGT
jgi:hypothetical protein